MNAPVKPSLKPYTGQLPDMNNPATWAALTVNYWTWNTGDGYTNLSATVTYCEAAVAHIDAALAGSATLVDTVSALTSGSTPAGNATRLGGRAAGDYLAKLAGASAWDLSGNALMFGTGVNEDSLHFDDSTNTFVFRGDAAPGDLTSLGVARLRAKYADFDEWSHSEGLKITGFDGVKGILVGDDGTNASRSGRIFWGTGSGAWATYAHNGELLFTYGGDYGSSSGAAMIRFRGDGSICAPNADGSNVAGADDLFNRGYADQRYQRDTRLGAEATQLFAGAVTAHSWFRAPTSQVMTGVRVGPPAEGGTRVTGMAWRPVQKHINGAWVTVAQA